MIYIYIYSGQINYIQGCKDVHCAEDSGFSDAVSAAKSSDLVLYVGGISKTMEGEGNDRASIILPGKQPDLITQSVPPSSTPSFAYSFIHICHFLQAAVNRQASCGDTISWSTRGHSRL